jgi:hypothetical protein
MKSMVGVHVLLFCSLDSCWSLQVTAPRAPSVHDVSANMKSTVLGGIFVASCLLSGTARAESYEWDLMNGNVALQDPIALTIANTGAKVTLLKPQLIGAGGGGAVFAFEDSQKLLKISWEGSAKSVERECSTLQLLETHQVEAAERCLGKYEYDGDKNRVMILAEPYLPDGVATALEVDQSKRAFVVEQIARTLIQMLAANIVTIDVQPLISKETGQVVFIDMTEAQELKPPFTFLAITLMSSFTTEMMTLIPEEYMSIASKAALREIAKLDANGVRLSPEAMEVLQGQTYFFDKSFDVQ